ncbi:MAG: L,D-transpeptidase [Desulfobacterium sp.]|nr:L,D-transpeptidase [Desulfobacterium sp.]MBU3949798.1 L,D-transpeptidase [Pseudomonadota bacterium]MBU4010649.1 L,D-transpeptidase [Pseudomonadota bacterium]MBU4035844.1 L,D-transpeptidase [Pseudomonadota bacterium]
MPGNNKFIKIIIALFIIFLAVESVGYYLGTNTTSPDNKIKTKHKTSLNALKVKNTVLKRKLASFNPDGIYIVVDSGMNRLYLKKGNKTIREAIVSCGSGNILKDPSGERQWIFDTPVGEYKVKSKRTSPLWTKPDWAFIEDGEAIPKDPNKRIEKGVLGDYALGFGNGYFIHGTLYSRLLGRNVSHGCIRVGDKDLKIIYNAAELGARIYIF